MKHFLLYFTLTISTVIVAQQNDSILKVNADTYLFSKYGKKFVESNLKFSEVIGAGVIAVFYETNCHNRNDGRNTIMVCSKYTSNEIDTSSNLFTKKEILQSMNRKKPSNLLIGKKKALEIAKLKGIAENKYPLKISAHNFGAHQEPKWGITSTDYDDPNGHGAGSWINVNMKDGSAELGQWSSIP